MDDLYKKAISVLGNAGSMAQEIIRKASETLERKGCSISRPGWETADAGVFWNDLAVHKGWKIQQNKVFGQCRILGPDSRCYASIKEPEKLRLFLTELIDIGNSPVQQKTDIKAHEQAVRQPQAGDILWAYRGLYNHCGIYEGDGKVIHFAAPQGSEISPGNAVIHRASYEHFKDGCLVKVIDIEGGFSAEETVSRARSRIGERGYDFTANNCDHFAMWCKTGEHRSIQVDGVKAILKEAGAISRGIDRKTGGAVQSAVDIVCQIHDIMETFKAPNRQKD